jgi:cyanophycin synthetase
LNGEDHHCAAMIEYCTADQIYLVYSRASPEEAMPRLTPGRYAICVKVKGDKHTITVLCGTEGETPIIDVAEIPATWNGTAFHNVQNAMFAIGMALGLNIEPGTIRNALSSFSSSIDVIPGRLNLFDALRFKVLIDYAHNAHGYEALCRCVRQLAISGKQTLIVFSPERQNHAERKAIAGTVVGEFDEFICRGRRISNDNNEVDTSPYALRTALLAAGAAKNAVEVVPDLHKAVELALLAAREGDLIVVSATGHYREVWDQLTEFREGKLLSDSEGSGQLQPAE